MIKLKAVDADNFWDIIDLDVKDDQKELVTSNAISLGQAYVQPECIPLAVYQDDQPVGFAMYCVDRDDGEYWLYRLMIDKRYQGKGYAKEAMALLLRLIRADTTRHKIFLGVHLESIVALRLYKSFGFAFNGQVFGKEHIMLLEY